MKKERNSIPWTREKNSKFEIQDEILRKGKTLSKLFCVFQNSILREKLTF